MGAGTTREGFDAAELRARRIGLGLSQAALATELGIAANTLARWERGVLPIRNPALVQLALERLRGALISGDVPRLPSSFAPSGLGRTPPNNLPAQLTSFVGRERHLAAIENRLLDQSVRLISLTGPGGVGKTRLALQVAHAVLAAFEDGVYLVPLASTQTPQLVASAIVRELKLLDANAQPLEALSQNLRERNLLLVLDNFEQLLDAAVLVSDLLRACPRVKVLATSRSPLRLSGEHVFDIPPLAVPNPDQDLSILQRSEAGRLFIDRARSADPDFSLTEGDVAAVTEICRRLDGLPLAIELVAARVRTFSVTSLNTRLAQRRLSLLSDAPRDAPARHQTLRATMAWSHALLTPPEQRVFRRLAVFAGGCTGHEATRVCQLDDEPLDVEGHLEALVDRSLLRRQEREHAEPRYVMLETIREFALEQLELSGEVERVRRSHANTFNQVLEEAAQQRGGPSEALSQRKLFAEQDNVRTAMTWAIEHQEIDLALQMADAGLSFLLTRGFTHQGLRFHAKDARPTPIVLGRLEEVLQLSSGQPSPHRIRVLVGAGRLAHQLGELVAAERLLGEAVTAARSAGDLNALNLALGELTFLVHERGDFGRALALAEENVTLAERIGDRASVAQATSRLAEQLVQHGDVERGTAVAEEARRLAMEIGDQACLAAALHTYGLARRLSGDYQRAAEVLEQSVESHRALGHKVDAAEALFRWADVLVCLGDFDRAAGVCAEGLALTGETGSQRGIASALRVAARLANGRGEHELAIRLATMAERLHAEFGAKLMPTDRADLDEVLRAAEERVGTAGLEAIQGDCGVYQVEDALSEALLILQPDSERTLINAVQPAIEFAAGSTKDAQGARDRRLGLTAGSLTGREQEVLELVAAGRTNREIAHALVISERTAEAHVSNALGKLGLTSRAQLAVWATEHGLRPAALA